MSAATITWASLPGPRGRVGGEDREFSIGIGKAAQAKHQFRAGDVGIGQSHPVMDDRREAVEVYQTSKLRLIERAGDNYNQPPPGWGFRLYSRPIGREATVARPPGPITPVTQVAPGVAGCRW